MTPETLDHLRARLAAASQGDLARVAEAVFLRAGLKAQARAAGLVRERMGTRTGRLARSIRVDRQEGEAATIELALRAGDEGGDIAYAAIQEYGGQVVPRRAQFLRIPLRPALTGAGVDRYGGPLRTTAPKGMFRVVRAADGDLFLVNTERNDEPWYKLTRGPIVIREKRYLRDAADEALTPLVAELGDIVVEVVRGAVE